MTGKRFTLEDTDWSYRIRDNGAVMKIPKIVDLLNDQHEEKEQLKQEKKELEAENEKLKDDLKRCRDWINSDKNDYELTLAFIKNKGYSLKDVLEYEKELKMND